MATLSDYALCSIADVVDLLGYNSDQATARNNTIIRAINSVSKAIKDRAQCEFVQTDAEQGQTRRFLIADSDVTAGRVRVGDITTLESVTAVGTLTPGRDQSFSLAVPDDFYLMPDPPDPGYPYQYLYVPALVTNNLTATWWLTVTADWGFPAVPDDIVMVAIGSAMAWVLNDAASLTALAKEQGRTIKPTSLIPSEYLDVVDGYRLYRIG